MVNSIQVSTIQRSWSKTTRNMNQQCTSETSSRTSPSKGRVAGTGRQRGGGGGGVGREEGYSAFNRG